MNLPSYAHSSHELKDMLRELQRPGLPSFFRLDAQLPSQGRTDTPVAATERLAVMVKAYAGTGGNELHAHPNEDHVFIVLQGQASFRGPAGEERTVGPHESVPLLLSCEVYR